jgi:hypothetical protein
MKALRASTPAPSAAIASATLRTEGRQRRASPPVAMIGAAA